MPPNDECIVQCKGWAIHFDWLATTDFRLYFGYMYGGLVLRLNRRAQEGVKHSLYLMGPYSAQELPLIHSSSSRQNQ